MSSPIRIAISGGGLAGATLLHGVLKHEHLDVHVFESAATFNEGGAAIGVARNALTALELLGPTVVQCLERAGALPMKGVRFMLAQGQGEMFAEADAEVDGERLVSIVHRAAFLRELLADVPQERLHAAKKLQKVDENSDGSMTLHFADGATHDCDILVGADGIHSIVRKLILGDDLAAAPRNTGAWTIMTLKTAADVEGSLGNGPYSLEEAREYQWVGDGAYALHNMFNQGQIVQFIVAAYDDQAKSANNWHRTVGADELEKLFKDWPIHLKKAVNELLCDQREQPAMYLWDHAPAHTYVKGPICIMGDAAHSTSPWQGSGGGMTIEDSLILSTLLGRASSVAEAVIALKIYDQLRRPRTQRIVESSRETGRIMAGRGAETGLDLEKLKENVLPRWDFIIDFDNQKHRDEALKQMDIELTKSRQ